MQNPYTRFTRVSNVGSALIILIGLAAFGPPTYDAVTQYSSSTGTTIAGLAAATMTVMIVFWMTLNEAIFPLLFKWKSVRQAVLGKYYLEGTWIQAERNGEDKRMAVIDIQPAGSSFIFSGFALDQDFEIQSNTRLEFSKFEWPFMTYKYRNSLSDGADGRRDGVGELQFEMNEESSRRYNGFVQYVKSPERIKIEGAKIMKGREVRKLRTLEGRHEVFDHYWDLFFNRQVGTQAKFKARTAPRFRSEEPVARRMYDAPRTAPTPMPTPVPAPEFSETSVNTITDPLFEEAQAATLRSSPAETTSSKIAEKRASIERRRSSQQSGSTGQAGVVPRRRATDWSRPDQAPKLKDDSRSGTDG